MLEPSAVKAILLDVINQVLLILLFYVAVTKTAPVFFLFIINGISAPKSREKKIF